MRFIAIGNYARDSHENRLRYRIAALAEYGYFSEKLIRDPDDADFIAIPIKDTVKVGEDSHKARIKTCITIE